MTRVRTMGCLVAACLLVAAVGCGSDDGDDGDASATTTTAPAAEVSMDEAEQLAGKYAHYDVVAYESTDMKILIISYGFTDLAAEGGELVATESFCTAKYASDQPIAVTISDKATRAIVPESTPVELREEDGQIGFVRPATPTGIGIELEDPANDPLPTDPDDPRIADDDGDGKPGITVKIEVGDGALTGELYIARREIFAYDVLAQDDGALVGTVDDHSEQLIIGASDDQFITTAPWVQVDDPEKSPIILEPVEGDWDCDRLIAEIPTLFPAPPEVDW